MFLNPFIGIMGLFLAIILFIETVFYLIIKVQSSQFKKLVQNDPAYKVLKFKINGAIKISIPIVIFMSLVIILFVGGMSIFIDKSLVFAIVTYSNNEVMAVILYLLTLVCVPIGSWCLVKITRKLIIK